MLCTEMTLLEQVGNAYWATPLYCNRWSCDICAPRRSAALRRLARRGDPDSFLTLTIRAKPGDDPDDLAVKLAHAWRRARRALMRERRLKSLPFLAVFERTKRGFPHLHILMRAPFIPQRTISRLMDDLIGSPIVDIRRISTAREAAAYVSKYVGKDPHAFLGVKRYWRSQDWWKPDPDGNAAIARRDAEFRIIHSSFEWLLSCWEDLYYTVERQSNGAWLRPIKRVPP